MLSRRAALGTVSGALLRAQRPDRNMFADAEAYERFMGRWSRLMAPLLVDFARLPAAGTILDVGSGTGSLAMAIAQRSPGYRVVGIDLSQQYVDYANARSHPDSVRFQLGDAQKLSFPDATFDASVSLLVFNFIPDAAKALAEIRRVTRPGGPIAAAVWDYGDGMRMLRIADFELDMRPAVLRLRKRNVGRRRIDTHNAARGCGRRHRSSKRASARTDVQYAVAVTNAGKLHEQRR